MRLAMPKPQGLAGLPTDQQKPAAGHGVREETSLQEKQKRALKAKDDLRKAWAKRKAANQGVVSKDFSGFSK